MGIGKENLPGGEIIQILQAAQGREFTYWEGSYNRAASSEVKSWLPGVNSYSGRPEVSEPWRMPVLQTNQQPGVE